MIGKNTASGEALRSFIERVEQIREKKKDLSADEKQVWAEAKAAGYTPDIMRTIVKRRAMKPADIEEAESLLDMYQHAMGMLPEPPLFRSISNMNVDITARESVISALKQLVPEKGELIVNVGSDPVRLFRNNDGDVVEEDWRKPEPQIIYKNHSESGSPKKPKAPDETPDEAEDMGRAAYKSNQPIISNPFPAGTEQRARFDLGYRKESGSDGMGDK